MNDLISRERSSSRCPPKGSSSGFALIVLWGGVLDVILDVFAGFFKFPDGFAQGAADLGELFGTEQNNDHKKNNNQFRHTYLSHNDASLFCDNAIIRVL